MHIFRHGQRRTYGLLLDQSNAVLSAYIAAELGLQTRLGDFLEVAVTCYREAGRAERENALLALHAELAGAGRGIDPMTFEPITTRRGAAVRAVCLRVLKESAALLRADMVELDGALASLRAQLLPIVLAAMQRGLIDQAGPPPDAAMLDAAWRQLRADGDIGLAARQAQMQASIHDIHLVLGDLIAAARG